MKRAERPGSILFVVLALQAGAILTAGGCSSSGENAVGRSQSALASGTGPADALINQVRSLFTYSAITTTSAGAHPPRGGVKRISVLTPSLVTSLSQIGGQLTPQLSSVSGISDPTLVQLPTIGTGPIHLADSNTGLAVDVTLDRSLPTSSQLAQGYVVYLDVLPDGGNAIHAISARGTEHFLEFPRQPTNESVSYTVSLGPAVSGIRTVSNVVEFLDATGTPRLRLSAPRIIDATGAWESPPVTVSGCSVDRSTLPPFNRATVSPGPGPCIIGFGWARMGVHYPILLDPSWSTPVVMSGGPRAQHSATLTSVGVLVVGGIGPSGVLASTELYQNGVWTAAGDLPFSTANGRVHSTATLLQDGRVLVAGGNDGTFFVADNSTTATAAIYSPGSTPCLVNGLPSSWCQAPSMSTPRFAHAAAPTGGGVLVAGGTAGCGAVSPCNGIASSEFFDPLSGWQPPISMLSPRIGASATTLSNGDVLVIQGANQSNTNFPEIFWTTSERYDSASASWQPAGQLPENRSEHTATLLTTGAHAGSVMVAGGFDELSIPRDFNTTRFYDGGAWDLGPSFDTARYEHQATRLLDGRILLVGGISFETGLYLASADLFDPLANSWSTTAPMSSARTNFTVTTLSDGTVLAAGGVDNNFAALDTSETFSPSGCSSDTDCSTGSYCQSGTCVPKKALGALCSSATQCGSGFCADGVCCVADCLGQCQSCAELGSIGTCVVVTGTPPITKAPCTGAGATCGGLCDGASVSCTYPGGSVSCGPSVCANGVTSGSFCDGGGGCAPGTTQCAPYLCNLNGTACASSCSGSNYCVASFYCDPTTSHCLPLVPDGEACTSFYQCDSGFCRRGVCSEPSLVQLKHESCTNNSGCPRGYVCDLAAPCGNPKTLNGSDSCPTCVPGLGNGAPCKASSVCASGFCVDGSCCGSPSCPSCYSCSTSASRGSCQPLTGALPQSSSSSCAANSFCSAGTCTPEFSNGTPCSADFECTTGACISGSCQPPQMLGSKCQSDSECASGHCATGVCCSSACTGACASCSLSSSAGTCIAIQGQGNPSCAPYLCNGSSLTCPTSCRFDSDCATGSCKNGQCLSTKRNKEPCANCGPTPPVSLLCPFPNTWQYIAARQSSTRFVMADTHDSSTGQYYYYGNNIDYSWKMFFPQNITDVQFRFDVFNTESGLDWLKIRAGGQEVTLTGNLDADETQVVVSPVIHLAASVFESANEVEFSFHTDGSVAAPGWILSGAYVFCGQSDPTPNPALTGGASNNGEIVGTLLGDGDIAYYQFNHKAGTTLMIHLRPTQPFSVDDRGRVDDSWDFDLYAAAQGDQPFPGPADFEFSSTRGLIVAPYNQDFTVSSAPAVGDIGLTAGLPQMAEEVIIIPSTAPDETIAVGVHSFQGQGGYRLYANTFRKTAQYRVGTLFDFRNVVDTHDSSAPHLMNDTDYIQQYLASVSGALYQGTDGTFLPSSWDVYPNVSCPGSSQIDCDCGGSKCDYVLTDPSLPTQQQREAICSGRGGVCFGTSCGFGPNNRIFLCDWSSATTNIPNYTVLAEHETGHCQFGFDDEYDKDGGNDTHDGHTVMNGPIGNITDFCTSKYHWSEATYPAGYTECPYPIEQSVQPCQLDPDDDSEVPRWTQTNICSSDFDCPGSCYATWVDSQPGAACNLFGHCVLSQMQCGFRNADVNYAGDMNFHDTQKVTSNWDDMYKCAPDQFTDNPTDSAPVIFSKFVGFPRSPDPHNPSPAMPEMGGTPDPEKWDDSDIWLQPGVLQMRFH